VRGALEQRGGAPVDEHGEVMLAEFGAVLRVAAGALAVDLVGVAATFDRRSAIGLEGDGASQHQVHGLVQALGVGLHGRLCEDLLSGLGHGLLQALLAGGGELAV
jgi:hypothetical protein